MLVRYLFSINWPNKKI